MCLPAAHKPTTRLKQYSDSIRKAAGAQKKSRHGKTFARINISSSTSSPAGCADLRYVLSPYLHPSPPIDQLVYHLPSSHQVRQHYHLLPNQILLCATGILRAQGILASRQANGLQSAPTKPHIGTLKWSSSTSPRPGNLETSSWRVGYPVAGSFHLPASLLASVAVIHNTAPSDCSRLLVNWSVDGTEWQDLIKAVNVTVSDLFVV